MKEGIHPEYHEITVQMTDGSTYTTRSTWGKEGDVLKLDIDPSRHQAWTGEFTLKQTGQVERFNSRYKGLSFAAKKKSADSAA